MAQAANKTVALNRKARHDYFILDSFECGIVLTGTEIKSVRDSRVNLKDGYAHIKNGELWLENVHISPYYNASSWSRQEPVRPRKLLVHKQELRRLVTKLKEQGLTLVSLSMYLKEGKRAKVQLGLAQGKTQGDKRDSIKTQEAKRSMARELRNRN